MSSLSFTQIVSSTTRVTRQSSTLIDLTLVSELSLVYSCDIIPPLANSDHYGVTLQLRTRKVRYNRNATRRKVWKYDLVDFTGACNKLDDLQLEDPLAPNDINQSLLNWSELFLGTIYINSFLMLCSLTGKLSHG